MCYDMVYGRKEIFTKMNEFNLITLNSIRISVKTYLYFLVKKIFFFSTVH